MKKKMFVNTLVEVELNEKLLKIAADLELTRSEVVRLALYEFIQLHYKDIGKIIVSKSIKNMGEE